jgi:hypothetical protein
MLSRIEMTFFEVFPVRAESAHRFASFLADAAKLEGGLLMWVVRAIITTFVAFPLLGACFIAFAVPAYGATLAWYLRDLLN